MVIGEEQSATISQGSVLDDIARVPSQKDSLVLHADDMLLYRRIDSAEEFVNNLIKANYLTLNAAKCKYNLCLFPAKGNINTQCWSSSLVM